MDSLELLSSARALRTWQTADRVPLEEAMQGPPGQMRDRRLQHIQAIVEGKQRVPTKRDDQRVLIGGQHRRMGSLLRTRRFRHLATVLGLIRYRSLSAWIEAVDRCIAARMACECSWRFREVPVPQCLLGDDDLNRATTRPWD